MAGRYGLPENLPVPIDDGSAAHLIGEKLPALSLSATDGRTINLHEVSAGRWAIFIYPSTGVPGKEMPAGWDEIPGARGCTPEACSFRDNLSDLRVAGLAALFGLSTQESRYQRELIERLHLTYPMLSDPSSSLGKRLNLPVFQAGGSRYYRRLTLIINDKTIEHVFYPVFPPNEHAGEVLGWLRRNPQLSG